MMGIKIRKSAMRVIINFECMTVLTTMSGHNKSYIAFVKCIGHINNMDKTLCLPKGS